MGSESSPSAPISKCSTESKKLKSNLQAIGYQFYVEIELKNANKKNRFFQPVTMRIPRNIKAGICTILGRPKTEKRSSSSSSLSDLSVIVSEISSTASRSSSMRSHKSADGSRHSK